jgi:hypothetical protein
MIRILTAAAIMYYFLPISFEFGPAVDDKEAMADDGSSELHRDDEDEESGFFLPLMWPVEMERTFYKGSDPEWQEYMKFAKDKESQKRAHRMFDTYKCRIQL